MANNANIYPYPFQFDPSQWANKYSPYQGTPIPFPTQYQGTPTDALGNPIGSYLAAQSQAAAAQGAPSQAAPVSLNSSPFANVQIPQGQNTAVAEPYGGLDRSQWNALTPQQRGPAQIAMDEYQMGVAATPSGNNFVASGSNPSGANPAMAGAAWQGRGAADWNQMLASRSPASAAPAAAPAGPDMGQAYLNALSNPGKVTTPGANVPQAPLPTGQSNVLQSFLQNWQNKGSPTTGAGNYNNSGFFNALQGGQNA